MRSIYLDFNSTSPLLPEVVSAMAEAQSACYANPASQHAEGRRAHRALEDAREEIARRLGASLTDRSADRLIFTSGGTEANNLALLGLLGAAAGSPRSAGGGHTGRVIISSIEHPSVTATADYLVRLGWQVNRMRVTTDGIVCLDHLNELLAAESPFGLPRLISVMLASNETGVIQPIDEIVRRCAAVGVPVHTDAVQAVGKTPVDFRRLGVNAMTVAPHKFGGPRGIGALVVRHGIELQSILYGGTQQFGMRPGTESVALPIGFLTALKWWDQHHSDLRIRLTSLRKRFEEGIRAIYPHAVVNGERAARLPHTSNVAFPGHDRQSLLMALDLAGVCCSTGSACASGSSEPSPTLVAMNLPRQLIDSSLRFSLGPSTTAEEIDEALRRIAVAMPQNTQSAR